MRKNEDEAWEFVEDLAWKTMQWDSLANKPNASISANKGGIHSVDYFIATEAKIKALMRRIEALQLLVLHKQVKSINCRLPYASIVELQICRGGVSTLNESDT